MIEIQQAQFWLGVIGLAFAGVGATCTAVWTIVRKIDDDKASQDEKIEQTKKDSLEKAEAVRVSVEEKLTDKVKERNEKIEGVGKSLDKFKEEAYKNFVLEKVCCQMHLQNKEEIARIEKDNKEARHELRDMIQNMNLKLDNINAAIVELRLQK